MIEPTDGPVTLLLERARQGDADAQRRIFPLIYEHLRSLAQRCMRRERPDHTLQPTALVHEAYLRLIGSVEIPIADRAHFLALAAQCMRRILVEHARRHAAAKRSPGGRRAPLSDAAEIAAPGRAEYLIALDEALQRLAAFDPQAARIVELRFFGGMSVEQTAETLGISPRTVKRDWAAARSWLAMSIGR